MPFINQEAPVSEPSVFLKALTPEAKASLGGTFYKITHFPFRVGRESRAFRGGNPPESRRHPETVPNNDLYLVELGSVLTVSREHFLIDRQGSTFIIVDRGSTCGTLLEGDFIGEKKQGGWKPLQNHDVIIVGPSESRFVFKFVLVESA
jgi:hypothetical protein